MKWADHPQKKALPVACTVQNTEKSLRDYRFFGVFLYFGSMIINLKDMRKKELYASPQTEVMDFSPGQMLCASVGPGDFGTGNLPGFDFDDDDDD